MRFQCKYIAPPRDQYFTDIFNCSQNNAFVVIINKSNIKLVIKYGTFSLVFLTLFLLKYQLIKIRWYFKRNKDRNTRENMPYLITRLIFAIYLTSGELMKNSTIWFHFNYFFIFLWINQVNSFEIMKIAIFKEH